MMKRLLLLVAAMSVGACTIAPYKQPLDTVASSKLARPAVYSRADDRGVGVQYFAQDSSAAGAPYGLIGALVTATLDAVANSGPIGLAEDSAAKLSPSFDHAGVNSHFNEALQTRLGAVPLFELAPPIQPLSAERKWEAGAFSDPAALLTSVEYSLTQDLRTLQVVLTGALVSREAAGPSVDRAKSKPGKPKAGVVYRNRFTYHSQPLGGLKTPEEVEAEVDLIKAKYRSVRLAERKAPMQKEIAAAREQIAPEKTAEFYLAQWLANDAALLRSELQAGLAAVAELLASDLQDPTPVDDTTKELKTIVVKGETRVVARVNQHPFKGSLSSEPVDLRVPMSNGTAYPRKDKEKKASAAAGE